MTDWSKDECTKAARVMAECIAARMKRNESFRAVSTAIGRSVNAVSMRFYGDGFVHVERKRNFVRKKAGRPRGPASPRVVPSAQIFRVPAEVLADRDAREAARDRRDQTAAFCGDPPPGFSALDRRRGEPTRTAESK